MYCFLAQRQRKGRRGQAHAIIARALKRERRGSGVFFPVWAIYTFDSFANRMKGMTVNDRITELEIRFSLMEDLVETLNRTVFHQQKQLAFLQAQLRHLYGQMQAEVDADATPLSLREEVPPHY